MDNLSTIVDLMGKVQFFTKSKKIDQAIDLMIKHSKLVNSSPDLLVEMGRLIQLSSDDIDLTLGDAHECFQKALEIDERHPEALSELGWYYLNVEDDAKKAKSYFDLSLGGTHAVENYIELFEGAIDCLIELKGVEVAVKEIKSNDKLSEKQKSDLIRPLSDNDGVVFW